MDNEGALLYVSLIVTLEEEMKKRDYLFLSLCAIVAVSCFSTQRIFAQESPKTPLTLDTARLISEGKIRLEDGSVDSLLYKGKILDPAEDDDGDGLVNAEEMYTYLKDGRQYYGYNSHPLLYDTDGDGISDKEDSQIFVWNVTLRDMVMFMELVYRDDQYINEILDENREVIALYGNRLEYAMMHNELSPFWKVKETYHLGEGFDAVLFETQSRYPYLKDGTVQVLGIRGTKGARDVDDDLAIFLGTNPRQANVLEELLKQYDSDPSVTNLYVTGHSLGGYLAQRGLIEANKKGYTWYKQAYTFNAPKIKGNLFNSWLSRLADEGNELMRQGKAVHYIVDNDKTVGMVGTFDGAISVGSSSNGHGSRTYFEGFINALPEFSTGKRTTVDGVGHSETIFKALNFNEKLTDSQVYTDVIVISEEITEGATVDLLDNIKDLPNDALLEDITDYESMDLTRNGNYTGKVRLIFSDQSEREVEIPIVVSAKKQALIEAEQYTPRLPADKVEVVDPTTISQEEEQAIITSISNLNKGYLPDTVRYQIEPEKGLIVLYEDQSEDIITFDQLVKKKEGASASPTETVKAAVVEEIPSIPAEDILVEEVYQGEPIALEDNVQNLPEGSTIEVIETVSNETVGRFEAMVKVTFNNKASRLLRIPVVVKEKSGQGDEETSNLNSETETKTEQVTVSLPYRKLQRENPSLEKGVKQVVTVGKNGSATITYEVTYTAGKETNRIEVNRSVVTPAVDEVTEIGTREVVSDTRLGTQKERPKTSMMTGGIGFGTEQPILSASNPVVFYQNQKQETNQKLPATGASAGKTEFVLGVFILGFALLTFIGKDTKYET